jgi:hypothetical protein
VVKGGFVFATFETGLVEAGEPDGQHGRCKSGGFHLPQGDPDAGAAVAILRHRRWRFSRRNRVHDTPLDREIFAGPERLDRPLKGIMTRRIEWPARGGSYFTP